MSNGSAITPETGFGTLNVVLATEHCIVAATDSRRTNRATGSFTDGTKKLFRVGEDRFLTIAGLVDIQLPHIPDIALQVPALLEESIARLADYDWGHWNDPPELNDQIAKSRFHIHDPYSWWSAPAGPLQTLLSILATYGAGPAYVPGGMQGLVTGFKSDGTPKMDRLVLQPATGRHENGRTYIGIHRFRERVPFTFPFTFATAGITELADNVLSGTVSKERLALLTEFPAIHSYLERRSNSTLEGITEADMVELCKSLIAATSAHYPGVGSEPVQIGVIRATRVTALTQPITSVPPSSLPSSGMWFASMETGGEYPFSSQLPGMVFTNTDVFNNASPIPLDGNYIYGCTLRNATLAYCGGKISFGNNKLTNCELRIHSLGEDSAELRAILGEFSRVIREPRPWPVHSIRL